MRPLAPWLQVIWTTVFRGWDEVFVLTAHVGVQQTRSCKLETGRAISLEIINNSKEMSLVCFKVKVELEAVRVQVCWLFLSWALSFCVLLIFRDNLVRAWCSRETKSWEVSEDSSEQKSIPDHRGHSSYMGFVTWKITLYVFAAHVGYR